MTVNESGAQGRTNEIPKDSGTIHQTIIVKGAEPKTNGLGVAGFVLALLGLFLSLVPILGWIIWFLGFLFSLIGVFKVPRGLAIAGLIISVIGFIVLVAFIGLIAAAIVSQ